MAPSLRIFAWSALAYGVAQAQTASLTSRAGAADGLSATPVSSTISISSTQPASNTVLINGTSTVFKVMTTLPASVDETQPVLPNIYDPQAVSAQSACPGYTASNVVSNAYGFHADLTLAGPACHVYGNDVSDLSLAVQYQSGQRLSVKISPKHLDSTNISRYEIPSAYVGQPGLDHNAEGTVPTNDLQFIYTNTPSFGFAVIRKSTGDVLFDTRGKKLVFEDQFVEFATSMPKGYNMYGLGERIHGFRLGNNFTATIYAADAGDPIDGNIYGSHPIYVDTRYYEVDQSTGNLTLVANASAAKATADYVSYSHAVFLRNAHGQEVLMRPSNVTWRTLGGNVDLYFYDGPTVTDIVKEYQTSTVGLPAMQSYWTFGYHQCRWGYANWTELDTVVNTFRDFNIPLETIWTDIDYMDLYKDFENDPYRFSYPEGKQFLGKLSAQGQHYVPIVDSAIYIPNPMNASDAYGTYTRGNDSNVFMTNPDGSQYIGAVWPGYTVFPDWRAPNASSWWTSEMHRWHDLVDFSGIWIDMSEVSSFCVGSCGTGHLKDQPVHPPFGLPGEVGSMIFDYPEGFNLTNSTEAAIASSKSSSQAAAMSTATSSTSTQYLRTTPTPGSRNEAFPPYVINNINGALPIHAVSPNATHADGTSEYDIHNLFGHDILNATYNALVEVFPGKRPFIIGRSTFAGSGKSAGHWGGDNASKWYYMFFSIPQALSFSIFGIPMFGVDTCGFGGATDEELCNRWMQLSAFFPFYRNHNTLSAPSQEPYVWASVADATRKAIHIRYSLLPYMYTLFHQAHTTGSTVMRALAWEFPNDPSLASADRQFLLGPSLMVTPVLEQGAKTVKGVFPGVGKGTVWYDWYSQMVVNATAGKNTTIDAPLSHIPLFIRGGSILPMQAPGYTTEESRKNPWALLAALDTEGSATGSIYLDDGESIKPNATRSVSLTIAQNALYASSIGTYQDRNSLANVTILGVSKSPSSVTLNGKALPASDFKYNSTSKVLAVTGLNNATMGGVWAVDWSLAWSYSGASSPCADGASY